MDKRTKEAIENLEKLVSTLEVLDAPANAELLRTVLTHVRETQEMLEAATAMEFGQYNEIWKMRRTGEWIHGLRGTSHPDPLSAWKELKK